MTNETTETEEHIIQKPAIKLIRGQKGGYGWEIKILELNTDKLEDLNNEMLKKFGGLGE